MTHCPYCTTNTESTHYRHPETALHYCTPEHAAEHIGLASTYVLAPDYFGEFPGDIGDVYPAEEVPEHLRGYMLPTDDSDAFQTRYPFPTHCGSCAKALERDSRPGYGDAFSAEFPYCRACYYSGRAYAILHAPMHAIFSGYGLRSEWYHTGGGCWIVRVVRAGEEREPGEDPEELAPFVPFVSIGPLEGEGDDAVPGSGYWHPGEQMGAYYFDSQDAWDGEGEPKIVCPADAHALARFALRNLPEVSA